METPSTKPGNRAAARKTRAEEPSTTILLSPDELQAIGVPKAKAAAPVGGVLTVQIFFEVEGFGSFTAGVIDTIRGIDKPFVPPGITLPLTAKPAPGWQFSHWIINGLFGGHSPKHHVFVQAGLRIKAVFVKSGTQAASAASGAS